MARRRFRSNQRHEPTTERSFQEYILSTPAPQTSRTELLRLVRGGEDTFLELKVKLSNTEKIAQEIVALANTGGGVIVFGVNDQLRVEGVDDPEGVQEELVQNLPRRYSTAACTFCRSSCVGQRPTHCCARCRRKATTISNSRWSLLSANRRGKTRGLTRRIIGVAG